jgi:Ca2+-binding RTX toxin-like protein
VAVALAALSANGTSSVTFTFSEAVTGFTAEDLEVIGGTVTNLTADAAGKIFTGTFTPASNFEGTASVTVKAGSYADAAGNAGSAGTGATPIDVKAPTVDMFLKSFLGAQTLRFDFSDTVSAGTFTAEDVVISGATIEALAPTSSTSHTALLHVALSSGGKINATVKDGSYTDDSGNAGAILTKAFDITTSKATGDSDWLVGTGGRNTLKGGEGNDIIRGGAGSDVITGGRGKDLLDLSDGKKGIKIDFSVSDVKYATFDGRAAGLGADKYRDMEGVIGTKYSDKITGSSSGDILAGLGGNDILRGGRGNDVFVFEAKGGRDRVMDFGDKARSQDVLDVRYFDFNVTADSFAAWKASHVKQMGANVLVNIDATTSVTLIDVKAKAIGFDDFLF